MTNISNVPKGDVVEIEVNVEAYSILCQETYHFLTSIDESLSHKINIDEFIFVCKALLIKRIQWVQTKETGDSPYPKLPIVSTTKVPGPIFDFIYGCGKVVSVESGITFIPVLPDKYVEGFSIDRSLLRLWIGFSNLASKVVEFSDGLPSQSTGNWSYILSCETYGNGSSTHAMVTGPTREAKPVDAFLSGIVHKGRMLSGILYGVSYGSIPLPDHLILEYIKSFERG